MEGSKMTNIKQRAVGALVGMAVGDALGTPLWGSERDSQPSLTGMQSGAWGDAGDWGYTTSMALAIGRTIADIKEFAPNSIMHALLGWYDTGHYVPTMASKMPTSIPISEAVIESMDAFKKYQRIKPNVECTDAASLARTAPIAIAFKQSPQACIRAAKMQTDLTHNHFICQELCTVTAEAMRAAIYNGLGKEATFAFYDQIARKLGRWQYREREYIQSTPFVVHVIKASLWSIDSTNNFEEALIMAVNLGGESNMIGAITGQLAGAIYGVEAIPPRWMEQLAWREYIVDTANDLFQVAL